jgi:DNA-binding IclR family transcriptional regulator
VPIDIESFEHNPEEELRAKGRTNAERILAVLAGPPDQAFTPKEIHDATGIPRGSVGVVLSRLEDRCLVRYRGEYWAVGEDIEEIETTLSAMATARTATDRLGGEDPEGWGLGIEVDGDV